MTVHTDDGRSYESEYEYQHAQMFGDTPQEPIEDPKLYMVRHGDTEANDDDIVHGWVNVPLNDKGIEQAHKTADSLKDKDITHIITSDLPRAKQTANIIANKLGVPVYEDPRLRTWDSGDLDGTTNHDELKKYTNVRRT
jgi:broad specificity phosphatase PhoE